MRQLRLLIVAAAALAVAAPPGFAQCPDGTPPPCAAAAAPRPRAGAPLPIDPNRIAVLPFRVTTADTLLGEGIAELLSAEFSGESGPRAVHMGTVLRAWRQVGGRAGAPLPPEDAVRAARSMSAGLVVDGRVVGLGRRLTITATVLTVSDGRARRATPVSGATDSLDVLLRRFTTNLLAAAGGEARATERGALTESPHAMRSYIEGLAAFRRGRFEAAAVAFERAFAADTLFARAAFMRWLTSTWGPGFGTAAAAEWRGRAGILRGRLSSQDQLVLDAAFGNLTMRERATAQAPESPELWYFLGDPLYHGARGRGWTETIARARAAFERSLALDTQVTALHHLMEIGLWTADTMLLRGSWPAYDRLTNGEDVGFGWVVAVRTGDRRLLDELRRRSAAHIAGLGLGLGWFQAFLWSPIVGAPAVLIDEIYERSRAAVPPAGLLVARFLYFSALALQGRPLAAANLAREGPIREETFSPGFAPDLWLAASAALGDGDPVIGAAAVARLRGAVLPDSDRARARCAVRLWDALVGDSIVRDDDALMRAAGQGSCAELLDLLAAQRAGDRDPGRLARSDSVIRSRAVLFPYSGVGPLLLARAWEAQGDRARALAHLRSASTGFPDWAMAQRRRDEARLAALEGDTVTAIRVYREYLELRRDAEPALITQRDSVSAALAGLERRR